jgi:hypothetical protein
MKLNFSTAESERRVYRVALWIGAVLTVAYGSFFRSWMAAASVMIGMALAWVNFRWLSAGVTAVIMPANSKKIKSLLVKFLMRLVLVVAVLYAMIRVSLVGFGGVLLGLSMYVLAIMAEAILALFFSARN